MGMHQLPERLLNQPLWIENRADMPPGDVFGDPAFFWDPVSDDAFIYCTGADYRGRSVHTYRSSNLEHWRWVGYSTLVPPRRAAWAPEVYYLEGEEYPYVLFQSIANGCGPTDSHKGHRILRFHAQSPEGPFTASGHQLSPEGLTFAIDFNARQNSNGNWRVGFAQNFQDDDPTGTGLVWAMANRNLTALITEPEVLFRADSDWQTYEYDRDASDIEGEVTGTVTGKIPRWVCVEGVWQGLWGVEQVLSDIAWDEFVFYSGGCFRVGQFYAVGILAQTVTGKWENLSRDIETDLFFAKPQPEKGLHNIGHQTGFLGSDDMAYACLTARMGVDREREILLRPIVTTNWGGYKNVPYCLPL